MLYSQRNVLPVFELVQGIGTPALLGDEIATMTLLPAGGLSLTRLLQHGGSQRGKILSYATLGR